MHYGRGFFCFSFFLKKHCNKYTWLFSYLLKREHEHSGQTSPDEVARWAWWRMQWGVGAMWSYAVWWRHVSVWSTNHWHRCSGTENDNRIYSFPEGEDATRTEQEGGEGGQNHKLLSAWPLRVLLWSGWIQRLECGSGWPVKDPPLTLFGPLMASQTTAQKQSTGLHRFLPPSSNFSFKTNFWKSLLFKLHRVGGVRPRGFGIFHYFLEFPWPWLCLKSFIFNLRRQGALAYLLLVPLWAFGKS